MPALLSVTSLHEMLFMMLAQIYCVLVRVLG